MPDYIKFTILLGKFKNKLLTVV